jgi:glutamyl-tRNA synthetase/nondiscriminating glutamyl-tRNA synthetase
MRVRFAPSPTGQLHVGNARTALFNWLLARGRGGTFVLRIEDTDAERSTRESEEGILEDLRWLGLTWDEGPGVGGPRGPYRQSERLALYAEHANRLIAAGHAYHCFCHPERIEAERRQAIAEGRVPRYAGTCRGLRPDEARARVTSGEPAAVRFRVPDRSQVAFDDLVRGRVTFSMDVIGDPVLLRSDGRPSYNFAVVVDDAAMAITHVVRGEDHISNTPRQVLLYEALGLTPPAFAHLALVLGPDHTPLSKRHGATSVREFRERGILPEALVNYLALIGWSPGGHDEIVGLEEMARRFAIEAVGHHAGVFDPEKLAWANRHYMRAADPARLAAESCRFFQARGFVREATPEAVRFLRDLLPMAAGLVDRLEDIPLRVRFVFEFDPARALARDDVRAELADPGARAVIAALAVELAQRPRLQDRDAFRDASARVRDRTGQKGRALFHPIRLALTGDPGGPELDLAVPAIDRGAELPEAAGVAPIVGCRERAQRFMVAVLTGTGPSSPPP